MNISQKGIDLIKQFEGCMLTTYKCPAGVLTIGYGHTGSDVKAGMTITYWNSYTKENFWLPFLSGK